MSEKKFLALLNYAKQTLQDGDHVKTRKVASLMISQYPERLEGWLILAAISSPQTRMQYLTKAKEIAPDDARVQEAIGWAQKQNLIFLQEAQQQAPPADLQEVDTNTSSKSMSTIQCRPAKVFQKETRFNRINRNAFFRGFIHLAKKGLLIGLTIFVGVFITISIMNRPVTVGFGTAPAQLDAALERQIDRTISLYVRENPSLRNLPEHELDPILDAFHDELVEDLGLNLPKFQRQLLWTAKALKLDWGRLRVGDVNPFPMIGYQAVTFNLNQELLLNYLPNTLLLTGSAFLLVFLIGLPLALTLSRNYGTWYDRLISFFSPISSIPSWVIGIILIAIFAFELNVLPSGRMYDPLPPETHWGYIPVVLRHMALPVFSIGLSIFFQLVYAWRTYFVTFSSEDYVELGKAKGLPNRKLQRNYILRPSLSYVITSFSLMFVSFWQMTIALEVVFDWPGLGWLYVIKALPNIWGENPYPGDLIISISLVVMFAYLMGFVVLLLDLTYVIVDPRIRLGTSDVNLHLKSPKRNWIKLIKDFFNLEKQKSIDKAIRPRTISHKIEKAQSAQSKIRPKGQFWKKTKLAFREIIQYPSAVFGLSIILILVLGSLYAVIFLPYEKIGEQWRNESFTGQSRVPQLAKPAWFNLFNGKDYLSVINLNSQKGEVDREVVSLTEKTDQIILTFTFDYDYAEFPTEVLLYLSGTYDQKRPFASLFWRTPDGREIDLQNTDFSSSGLYDINQNIRTGDLLKDQPHWKNWFNPSNASKLPSHYLLFADPNSDQRKLLPGQYQLVVDGLVFEPESDIQAELVLLGQVYGVAGTDFYRRDLLVPLLWGMPFALLLGLFGALSTTIVSMIFAATGVWLGGWVDNLVQRLIDINLVLPILAIAVMAYTFLGIDIWTILIVYVFLNAFGSPTKNFRAAFLQIKEAPYMEAAKAYGAKNSRIIIRYMLPRLIPVLIPQLVILIPSFVFLEATLGFFNIKMPYPTWGTVIYQSTMRSGLFYSRYWMLQPIALLLLTGLGFSLFGTALERILNPRLRNE